MNDISDLLPLYLDGLFKKSYSYAFMKIVLYEGQDTKKQSFKKIRHYDIQSEAVNRIKDIIQQKIHKFKAITFLLLKYNKQAASINIQNHRSNKQKIKRTKNQKKMLSARQKTDVKFDSDNCEQNNQFQTFSDYNKHSNKKWLEQPETAAKQKLTFSRSYLVKPTNKQKTNFYAQRLSLLLDKARNMNMNSYFPAQPYSQITKSRLKLENSEYKKQKKTFSQKLYQKTLNQKYADNQSCKFNFDVNINIYQNDQKTHSYAWKATPNIRFFNKGKKNDNYQHFN